MLTAFEKHASCIENIDFPRVFVAWTANILRDVSIRMFASSLYSREVLKTAKLNSRCFCRFPAAMLVYFSSTPTWRLHTNLYKFEKYILPNNSSTEYCTALRLGPVVYLFLFYYMSFSWLNFLNGKRFMLSLAWRATQELQQNSLRRRRFSRSTQRTLFLNSSVIDLHDTWASIKTFLVNI